MGGSTTTTNSSSPPPEFLKAYQDLITRATGIANQPLQQYSGDIVAGLSDDQQAGIDAVHDEQGIASPFFNQASDMFGAGAAPITTNAGGIAADAGQAATSAAAAGGQGAIGSANTAAGQAGSAAAMGSGIALNGAQQGANRANQAAATDVWSSLPSFQSGIQQYMNPYTQQVVDATQAQFNNQNAQAQESLKGNAISAGAWGGDRAGVAQGIAAGQQALAQAPVIANLYNQGFQQGTNQYNTDKCLQANLGQTRAGLQASTALSGGNLVSNSGIAAGQLGANTALGAGNLQSTANLGAGQLNTNAAVQAGQLGLTGSQQQLSADQASRANSMNAAQGIAALGTTAQNSALADANSLLAVGGIQQQQQQAQLNVPYQQFQAQQQYPFQTQQFLNQAVTGAGANAGGTSSTTQPGPNVFSQLLGAGTTLGAAALLKRGGVVPRRASGGGISDIPDLSISYVPEIKPVGINGSGPPKPPAPAKQDDPMSDSMGSIVDMAATKLTGRHKTDGGIGDHIQSPEYVASHPATGPIDPDAIKIPDFEISEFRRGGIVAYPRRAAGGSAAAGGSGGGITMPHVSTAKRSYAPVAANLTRNYGNAAADANGDSTLPHTTYYPNVDPWWSSNPAHRTADGMSILPGLKNPTVGAQAPSANLDLANILGGTIYQRGGGIKAYADGGDVDDGLDDDFDDADYAPSAPSGGGIASGPPEPPFATHPIDAQPDGAHLPAPDEGGIAPSKSRYAFNYKPRDLPDAEPQDALKMSLMAAGLGMMAGHSHNFGENVGAGGLKGLETYQAVKKQNTAQALKTAQIADSANYKAAMGNMTAEHFSDQIDNQRKQLKQTGDHQTKQDLINQQKADELAKHHRELEDKAAKEVSAGNWEYLGTSKDKDGNPVGQYMDKKTQKMVEGPVVAKPSAGGSMSPETKRFVAERYLAGDKTAIQGFARNPQMRAELEDEIRAVATEQNLTGPEVVAKLAGFHADTKALDALAQRSARIDVNVRNANKAAGLVSTLSSQVNRTKYVPINAALNAWKSNSGDVPTRQLGAALNTFLNEYASAVAGNAGMTVAGREHAEGLLSKADGDKALNGVIKVLQQEMDFALKTPEEVRGDIMARIIGYKGSTAPDPEKSPAGGGGGAQAEALPVVNGKVDRTAIKPDVIYQTKAGPKKGSELLAIPVAPAAAP